MKNNGKSLINQSIPNEFSSTLIKYKVEHNQNIHYNYNLAEITAMREERIRENKENKKRQKIADCLKNCKQNIAKHNQENQSKINESISSVQRGKEYNENLRKQMKMKAEIKKKNSEKEINIKNYVEEIIPTFSFKEQQEDINETDNKMSQGFYNNNSNDFKNSNRNNDENNNVIDISKNILDKMQENSEIGNSQYPNQIPGVNVNQHNFMNNILYHKSDNSENNNKNVQQQINNNIQMIHNFRKTGVLSNNTENDNLNNNNYYQINPISQQDFYINDISSIQSGINFSTNMNLNTNNSNYFINEMNIQPCKYPENYRINNHKNKYKVPPEMNDLEKKRYKKALRKLVIDKFNSKKIDIPSICSCGQLQRKIDSLLNENKLISQNDLMNVDCANNCIYYQKPGSYHRALTDIIQSIRTLQLENGIKK